jgi:hypothetical protein
MNVVNTTQLKTYHRQNIYDSGMGRVTENVINEYGRSTFIFDGNSNYYIVKYCQIKH